MGPLTWGNMGTLAVQPGSRDDVVAVLTRHKPELLGAGCPVSEVGVNEANPDVVYVLEVWTSADAHGASPGRGTVRDAVLEVLPLPDGDMISYRFDIAGSPLEP
jgi:quinol monooxygenase YgiN